jgi:hypothetical protein
MPPSAIARGPITTRVLDILTDLGFPVGDNSSPADPHGWQGEPNEPSKTFIPWTALTAMPGQAQSPPGTFGDTGTEWRLGYNVFYAGISRKQTEALADRSRLKIVQIHRETVVSETGNWRIQKASCVAIGSSNRVGSAFPDYYTQSDSFEVWVTKERS